MSIKPLVSVICLSYNHGEYIRQALNSILMQKTNFTFEIIIHDDASNDNSATIIKEYYNKYPNIIVPILQSENQYSKKINIINTYIYPRVRGEYIAFCECDDYWIDELKLQKQVDFLKKNSEYSACIHAAYKVDGKTKKIIKKMILSDKDTNFTINDAIEGLGSRAATNSFMYRSKYIEYIVRLDERLPRTGVGDYLILVFLGMLGNIHYINSFMSVYRANVANSWTDRMSSSIKQYIDYSQKKIDLLNTLYKILPEESYNALNRKISKEKFELLCLQGNLLAAKNYYGDLYLELTSFKKLKIIFHYIFLKLDKSGRTFDYIAKFYKIIRKMVYA